MNFSMEDVTDNSRCVFYTEKDDVLQGQTNKYKLELACTTIRIFILVKLKLSHYTPRRSLGEGRYSSYLFSTSAQDGVSGQCHASAALYLRGKDPRYPLYRMLGGPQGRSGHGG